MLTKIVNGVKVVCSEEEEAAILAEWAANDAKPQTAKPTAADAIIKDPEALSALKAALAK